MFYNAAKGFTNYTEQKKFSQLRFEFIYFYTKSD